MKPPRGEISDVSREAILSQLDKVLSSESLQVSERSSNLLRFLVDQTVNGQSARLKEYTVGTEALGKGEAFDPRTDTIVRAEISRLRSRLERYYAIEGRADPLVITLPKGGYIPQFHVQSNSADGVVSQGKKPRSAAERFTWFALGIGVAACLSVLIAWASWRSPQPGPLSIAVLPFANISEDPGQLYFSDGITEEITSVLAQVPDLRVIARSSAFQFKGQNQDVRAVGRSIGASHLVEGSVRQAGNRVRITAQLVRAGDGVQLWSENYDRELTDIFVIQEEIAEAITRALRVPLGLKQGARLVSNRTNDLDSYRQFLRARALLRARSTDEATAILEGLVTRDPEYAPFWALLSQAYSSSGFRGTLLRNEGPVEEARRFTLAWFDKAEMTAREAIRLDSQLAYGYTRLGVIQSARGKWADADELFRRALTLDPNDPETLDYYARMLANVGYLKQSLGLGEQLRALEPFVPVFVTANAANMIASGQNEPAIRILEAHKTPEADGGFRRNRLLAQAYASEGRYSEAADTLLALPEQDRISRQTIENAAGLLRAAPTTISSPNALPELGVTFGSIYAYVGLPVRALASLERLVEVGHWGEVVVLFWGAEFARMRKTEGFKALMRKMGLVDYWRAHGWPDLCRPMGANDFACD
jgi:TolB-like protein